MFGELPEPCSLMGKNSDVVCIIKYRAAALISLNLLPWGKSGISKAWNINAKENHKYNKVPSYTGTTYSLLAVSCLLALIAWGWLRKTAHWGYVFQIGCQKKVLVLQLYLRVVREPLVANQFWKASCFLPLPFHMLKSLACRSASRCIFLYF